MNAFDDAQLDEWVNDDFTSPEPDQASVDDDGGTVAETWWRWLPRETMPILKYDLWRLLVLALQGGTYTDADTTPLQPISAWPTGVVDLTPPGLAMTGTTEGQAAAANGPSLVVGIEWTSDTLQRNKYNPLHDRRVGVVQWTFGAAPGHPVVIDSIRRVIDHSRRVFESSHEDQAALQRGTEDVEENRELFSSDVSRQLHEAGSRSETALPFNPDEARAVLEWTGPAVLTDSVAR
jgi:alpha 1,6-mannosyltransferase